MRRDEGDSRIRQVREPAIVQAFLERDRPRTALALTCLEPEWFAYSRFYLNYPPTACLWVFEHLQMGNVVQTFGESAGVAALLEGAELPQRAHVMIGREHLGSVERHYDLSQAGAYWRMRVTPETYRRPDTEIVARELSPADGQNAAALYALWDESTFEPSRLERDYIYFGVYLGGQLVAIAGNQVRSRAIGTALVLGVFVHPQWRERGLGKAVTAAITEALFDYGARDVVLNVLEHNTPAISAYERLGYRRHCQLLDALASNRLPSVLQ